jgi:hypothetical protein
VKAKAKTPEIAVSIGKILFDAASKLKPEVTQEARKSDV